MVFQRPVMLRRSVLDNVIYGLAAQGRGAQAEATAREMLGRVGLAHLADRPARVLSGGEQQRVALARAWALQARGVVARRADRQPRPAGHSRDRTA